MAENSIDKYNIKSLADIKASFSGIPGSSLAGLSNQNRIQYKISEEPDAPVVSFKPGTSQEEIDAYLSSPELSQKLLDAGFLYPHSLAPEDRLPAQKIQAPTMEDKGDFRRGLESYLDRVPVLLQGVKNVFGDVINNESIQEDSQKMIELYNLKSQAKQFYTTESGERREYKSLSNNPEDIIKSENAVSEIVDWGQANLGNGLASLTPIVASGLAGAKIGAVVGGPAGAAVGGAIGFFGSSFLQLLGGYRSEELEEIDNPNAAKTIGVATVGAALERVGAASMLIKGLIKSFGKEAGEKAYEELKENIYTRFAKGAGKGILGEATAEAGQQALSETLVDVQEAKTFGELVDSTSETLQDPEVLKRIRGAGYAGGLVGGVAGGGMNVIAGKKSNVPDKKFEGTTVNLGNTNPNDPDIADNVGKFVTVNTILEDVDKDGNPLTDNNGKPVQPIFKILGTQTIDGEKFAVLINKRSVDGKGGVDNPIQFVKMSELNSQVNEYVEPTPEPKQKDVKVKYTGVSQDQAAEINAAVDAGMSREEAIKKFAPNSAAVLEETETKTTTVPQDEPETFVKQNKNTVNAAIKRLKQRGLSNNDIAKMRKSQNFDDDIVAMDADEINYISPKERQQLDKLGYNETDYAQSVIARLEQDMAIDKKANKTKGRLEIEKILREKRQYKAFTTVNRSSTGTTTVPPKSTEELKKTGYTLNTDTYLEEDYLADIAAIDRELKDNRDDLSTVVKLQDRKRYLTSLYKMSGLDPKLRFARLESMIKGKGSFVPQLSNGEFVRIQEIPARRRGLSQQLQTTATRQNISEDARLEAVKIIEQQINELDQIKSDFDTLLISLGVDNLLTDAEIVTLTVGNKVIKKIRNDVKGKSKASKVQEDIVRYSKTTGMPKFRTKFYEDIPKIKAQLLAEMQRLGITNADLKVLNEYFRDGQKLDGLWFADYTVIDTALRMRKIAELMDQGLSFEKAVQTVPRYVKQDQIIIAADSNNPIAKRLKQDSKLYTLHHEAFHYFYRNGFFTENEVQVLRKAAEDWIKQYNLKELYPNASLEVLQEEGMANAFASYMASKYQPTGLISGLMYRVKAFLNALANALFQSGYRRPNDIFEALDLNKIQQRAAKRNYDNLTTAANNLAAKSVNMSKKGFNDWFSGSAVKGGTPETIRKFGSSTQNQMIFQILESSRIFKGGTFSNISNAVSVESGISDVNNTGFAVNNLVYRDLVIALSDYLKMLTGGKSGTLQIEDLSKLEQQISLVNTLVSKSGMAKIMVNVEGGGIDSGQTFRLEGDILVADEYAKILDVLENTAGGFMQKEVIRVLRAMTDIRDSRNGKSITAQAISDLYLDIQKIIADETTSTDIARVNMPLQVFHGTDKDFTVFKNWKDFFFHVGSAEAANARIGYADIGALKPGYRVIPLFASIQNPLRMQDLGSWNPQNVLKELTIKDGDIEIDGKLYTPAKQLAYESRDDRGFVISLQQRIFTPVEARRLNQEIAEKIKNAAQEEIAAIPGEADPYQVASIQAKYGTNGKTSRYIGGEIVAKAIQEKGYDGIVYVNTNELDPIVVGVQDSYIAFKGNDFKSVFNNNGFNGASPDIMESRSYEKDPSDLEMNDPANYSREEFRKQARQMSNMIKEDNLFEKGRQTTDEDAVRKFGKFQRIISTAKVWAMDNKIFAPLFNAVMDRQNKSAQLQFNFVEKLNENFMPAMRDEATREQLTKALEISQQVPGRYRPDAQGRIIFVAQRDGDGAGSTVKAGETVILQGDAAQAYMDVQEAIQTQHKEIIKGLLANRDVNSMLRESVDILKKFRPDLANNPILQLQNDQLENLEYDDIKFIVDELKNPATFLQPGNVFDPRLMNNVSSLLSKEIANVDNLGEIKGSTTGAGLNALLVEMAKYKRFKQNDYLPLQRYGNKFIAVKDAKGTLLEYRMFNKGMFGTSFMDEEADVRQELQQRYPDINIAEIPSQDVTINNLRQQVAADLQTIDSLSQFLSDLNVNNYVEIRKELDTIINKRVGADVKGYALFLQPRKRQSGVPGYSVDFARALSQYGVTSSEFASRNRFNGDIKQHSNYLQSNSNNEQLKKAADEWLNYTEDPKHEFANMRRLGFWWYLGGNLSSALLQTMSILQFTGPYLSEFSSSPAALKELMKAVNDVRKMMIFRNRKFKDVFLNFDLLPEDVRDDAIQDVANGLIKQSAVLRDAGMPSGQASYRKGSTLRNAIHTAEQTYIGGLFNTFETASRLTAYIATHRLAKNKKFRDKLADFLDGDQDFQYNMERNNGQMDQRMAAQHVINMTFGMYGKMVRPKLYKGLGSVIFLFNTYIHQMFSLMYRLATGGAGRNKKLIGRKILAKQLAMIMATGGIMALPFADDAAWLWDFAYGLDSGLKSDVRKEYRRWLTEHGWGPGAIEALETGLLNKTLDVDLSRRVRFNLPGMQQFRAALNMAGLNTGARSEEFLGAMGSLVFGNARGIVTDISQSGGQVDFDLVGKLIKRATPTFITNAYDGIVNYGIKDSVYTSYGTLISDDPTFYQAFMKSIGFNPVEMANRQEMLRLERLNGGVTQGIRQRFNNRIKNNIRKLLIAIREKDLGGQIDAQEDLQEIWIDLAKFNASVKPGLQFLPDTYRLLQEVFEDISPAYRLGQGSAYELMENYFDYQAKGVKIVNN